jgi:hypothetical protein
VFRDRPHIGKQLKEVQSQRVKRHKKSAKQAAKGLDLSVERNLRLLAAYHAYFTDHFSMA